MKSKKALKPKKIVPDVKEVNRRMMRVDLLLKLQRDQDKLASLISSYYALMRQLDNNIKELTLEIEESNK